MPDQRDSQVAISAGTLQQQCHHNINSMFHVLSEMSQMKLPGRALAYVFIRLCM